MEITWPQYIVVGGWVQEVYDQTSYDHFINEAGGTLATQEEIDFYLNHKLVSSYRWGTMPYIAALIVECKKRLDSKAVTAVDISTIINATNGKLDVDALDTIVAEHNEELVEYAIAAKTLITIFNALHTGTVESMKILANTTAEECMESCRIMWNKVSLKNIDNLSPHGYSEELYDAIHEYNQNPTL